MRKISLIAILCALCAALYAQSLDGNPVSTSRVTVDPVSDVKVRAGLKTPVTFTFRIQQGFHVNSNKPATPELIPTLLSFSPPNDLVIAKLQYPDGVLTSFPFDPTEKLSVYSGTVNVKALVLAQPNASPGPYTVHGELKYQACDNNSCYPPKKVPVAFTVNVSPGPKAAPRAHGNAQSPHIHN